MATFALGSGLCAAAPGTGPLVGFRVLQGVGAAVELPATLAILTHTFTDGRERAQAVGIWAGAAGSSLVVGPVLGGGLVAAFGWRSVFLLNLPVAVAVGVLTVVAVRRVGSPDRAGVDVPGQLLGTAALALLASGAIVGGRAGFASAPAVGLLVGGIAALAGSWPSSTAGRIPCFRSASSGNACTPLPT